MATTRSILVTGANQGLGMHTVHQLASTPDVLVFMGSRKLAAAEEAEAKFASDIHPSSAVVPMQLDITDEASIKNAHTFIADYLKAKNLPGLDVLVNNAAHGKDTLKATYEVNVFGTEAVTEAIRPLLNKGGAILNISSSLGSVSLFTKRPYPGMPHMYLPYSTSKAALNSLTVHWALQEELKGSGIRVVSICPGHNATNLNHYTGALPPAEGCKIIVKTAPGKFVLRQNCTLQVEYSAPPTSSKFSGHLRSRRPSSILSTNGGHGTAFSRLPPPQFASSPGSS